MLALVKTTAGLAQPAIVPDPQVGINDVVVRVHKTGICGTDLHIEAWDPWAAKAITPPLVVGHEFVGEIVEIGGNVYDFHPGDLVGGEVTSSAGCAVIASRGAPSVRPQHRPRRGRDGAFAEYVVMP